MEITSVSIMEGNTKSSIINLITIYELFELKLGKKNSQN
jgi:hypothetical protein